MCVCVIEWLGWKNMKTATCYKVEAVFNGMVMIKTSSWPNTCACEKSMLACIQECMKINEKG